MPYSEAKRASQGETVGGTVGGFGASHTGLKAHKEWLDDNGLADILEL